MTASKSLSFATDIRSMFTDTDVAHMKPVGLDLSNRDSVFEHADAIYATVSAGTMPPQASGEPRWTPEMCDRFKTWQQQGGPP